MTDIRDVTLCIFLDKYQHFAETCNLHLRVRSLIWKLQIPQKGWSLQTILHGVTHPWRS